MSEPVSNAEIEDVLSSIRRLVSENGAPAQGDAQAGASSEKLVLTPAFRVLDGQGDAPSEMPEVQPIEDAVEVPEPQPDSGLEARIAELENAIDNTYEEWEPDGSEEALSGSDPIILNHTPVDEIEVEAEAPDEMIFAEQENITAGVFDDQQEDQDQPVAETAKPDTPAEDDVFLDEDSLRDMVSQLVREELHGHVGERITRNVRRLVRREIKRALAIRDLE